MTAPEADVVRVLLLDELDETREHLDELVAMLAQETESSDSDLRVQFAHVYAHLNRAWFRWRTGRDIAEDDWDNASRHPHDLEPVG